MSNREQISVRSCFNFARRQTLFARLYHSRWPVILSFGVMTTLAQTVLFGLGLAAALTDTWPVAIACAAAMTTYVTLLSCSGLWQNHYMAKVGRRRGEPVDSVSWQCIPAALIAQAMHFSCLIAVLRMRRVDWRGITYEISPQKTIRMQQYRPYRQVLSHADATVL